MSFQDFFSQYQNFFLALETYGRKTPNLLLTVATFGVVALIVIRISEKAKKRLEKSRLKKKSIVITSQDIKAIAGEDVLATQLDLARAYIEMGKTSLAKQILQHVVDHGDSSQQQMARELTKNIL